MYCKVEKILFPLRPSRRCDRCVKKESRNMPKALKNNQAVSPWKRNIPRPAYTDEGVLKYTGRGQPGFIKATARRAQRRDGRKNFKLLWNEP